MKITVFCGANNGRNEAYKENAIELGKWIADNNKLSNTSVTNFSIY